MLNVRWTQRPWLKRGFALCVLAYFGYLGFVRVRAIVRADQCLEAGGHYDADAELCRR